MIKIRKPDLKSLANGIPKDFAEVMDYFNQSLEKNSSPYIPRKTRITTEEIKELWIPSLKQNICFVAELNKEVIGSANCFFNTSSSAYEQAEERKPGEIGLTVKADKNHRMVGYEILSEMIKELKAQNKKGFFHTDANFEEEILMIQDLGYEGKIIEDYERYKKAGLSGKVYEYELP
jgi:hypothetical protein